MDAALAKLRGRSRAKRTMWSRRAQEYQAKIASGDPASIAEVVRDLFRNTGQPEQSYSERQIYQAALDRLVREFAAVERIDEIHCGAARRAAAAPPDRRRGQRRARQRSMRGRRSARTGFARLRGARRIWAVAAIHGDAERLARLHDRIFARASGAATGSFISAIISDTAKRSAAAVDELLDFRRRFMARRAAFSCDVVFLRGPRRKCGRNCCSCNSPPTRARC